MKNLKDTIINEEVENWEVDNFDGRYKQNKEFLQINSVGHTVMFFSKDQIKDWETDFDMTQEAIEEILSLKPGELYDTDGGINIIVRIK